jgi:hypothetical protein
MSFLDWLAADAHLEWTGLAVAVGVGLFGLITVLLILAGVIP